MIRYVVGDATNPLTSGPKIIAHICNDIGKWGAGFVMAVSAKWPAVRDAYLEWYKQPKTGRYEFGLGRVLYVPVTPHIIIANMVAQAGINSTSRLRRSVDPALSLHSGWSKGAPIRYDALEKCLADVASTVSVPSRLASLHMPRIGCGLAGGKWDLVEPI